MPYEVREFQETPNPNALKCVLDKLVTEKPRSYFTADQASGDPLGRALFAIDGVTNILINRDWITVSKRAHMPWPRVRSAVQKVLREAP